VLGFSLSKILFTILIVVAVWKGFGLLNRLANERQAAAKRQRSAAAGSTRSRRTSAIELQECPRCGAYVDPREGCHCGVRRNEARRV